MHPLGTAVLSTIGFLLVFIVLYWAFRGFLPGSRIVEQELPAPSDVSKTAAKFTLFYVKWCPYSRDALEVFKSMNNESLIFGGKTVQMKMVDCEAQPNVARKYDVTAYPTYKLETSLKMYEYLGPPSAKALKVFLATVLGPENVV